jgi:DNA-binding XRE family transcriptional regulator
MAALSEEVGRAVGLMIGESGCPQAFNAFTEAVLGKLAEFAANKSQAIRLTPRRSSNNAEPSPPAAVIAQPAAPMNRARAAINNALEIARNASRARQQEAQVPLTFDRPTDVLQPKNNITVPCGPQFMDGQALRRARKAKGKTQEQVGKAVNLPQRSISGLEIGEYVGLPVVYERLRRVLGVPMEPTHG